MLGEAVVRLSDCLHKSNLGYLRTTVRVRSWTTVGIFLWWQAVMISRGCSQVAHKRRD